MTGIDDDIDDDTQYTYGNQLTLTAGKFDVVEGSGSDLDADMLDGDVSQRKRWEEEGMGLL